MAEIEILVARETMAWAATISCSYSIRTTSLGTAPASKP